MKPTTQAWIALAVGLLAIAAGLWLVVPARQSEETPETAPAPRLAEPTTLPETAESTADPMPDVSELLPGDLMTTKESLREAYESKREDIPEEVAEPVEQDLNIIERGIADLLTAIASDPEDDSLRTMLIATYKNEVKLLKKALHLSSDMEEEEIDVALE